MCASVATRPVSASIAVFSGFDKHPRSFKSELMRKCGVHSNQQRSSERGAVIHESNREDREGAGGR